MTRRILGFALAFTLGAIVGNIRIPLAGSQQVVLAQTRKPVVMRLFTGTDNQTHAEEMPVNFTGSVFKMLPVTGAELHRGRPGSVADWHQAPRRQYVITLSGQGEIEVAGGKKFTVEPGSIDLVEDVTGKGHITRETGTEERITLWLPIADSSNR